MLYTIFLMLGIIAILGEVLLFFSWICHRWRYRKERIPSYFPKAHIIVPCKGTTKNFGKNIQAICNQDYEDYKTVFVTDSTKDPAYKELKEIIGNYPKARIEISDFIEGCSRKISASIKGVKRADDTEVYVFADSDIRPHKDWLRYLVSHLNEDETGATTGYRWYFPHDLTSLLLSTWNSTCIPALFNQRTNFAWGGSMAISKKLFDELNIEDKWRKSIDDDLVLSKAVKDSGYKIKFVPECIVESYGDYGEESIRKFIKWSIGQFTLLRWYYPSLWIMSFITVAGLKFLNLLGLFLLLIGFTLPGLLLISTIFLDMIVGWQRQITFKKIMNYYPKERFGSTLAYIGVTPIVYFLIAYNIIASLFKKDYELGGRRYQKPGTSKRG
jgi:cellulose synthase/poly-beta-1,6-N-acetylglucosamine synthase-like glycosyltransferase